MANKNKPKMVTIQVIKGWNEGKVLSVGDRIQVHPKRAKVMEQLGYAVRVDPEAPYTHPAAKKEHQFKEVKFDEPEKAAVSKPDEPEIIHEPGRVRDSFAEVPGINVTSGMKHLEPEVEQNIKFEKTPEPQSGLPLFENFSYLNKGHLKALKGIKVYTLNQLAGWDVDSLAGIKGVSRKTAIKLIDDYNQYCNLDHNKDSNMEVTTK